MAHIPLVVDLSFDLPADDNAAMQLLQQRLTQYGNMTAFSIDLGIEGTIQEIIAALDTFDTKGLKFLAVQRSRNPQATAA